MNIQFYAKNLDLNDKMKFHVSSKLEKSLSRMEKVVGVQVDISRDKRHNKGDVFRVEVNLHIPKKIIRAIGMSGDVYAAMDIAQEKVDKQVRRLKDRAQSQKKKGWRFWEKN